jgi:3-oxoacyl-[acyl-carrier-protein] synthase III
VELFQGVVPDVKKLGLTYGVGVKGTGMYVPTEIITNQYWEERLETNNEWIIEKTGIVERRHMPEGQTTSDMCLAAANEALDRAGVLPSELDAIIISTITPDYRLPGTALVLKEMLGAHNAVPLDLTQVACSGVVYGMHLGAHLLQNTNMHNVLVIGTDALSRIYNPNERGSCVFFGDACGAVVLHRMKDTTLGIVSWDLESELNLAGAGIPHGGAKHALTHESLDQGDQYLYMNGREVWKDATRVLPQTLRNSIAKAGLEVSDIDFFVLHQANQRLIEAIMKDLDIDESKTLFNVQKYGNTGAGTMPTVLHEAIVQDRLKDGDFVAFAGIGAGFNWGSLILRYSTNSDEFE